MDLEKLIKTIIECAYEVRLALGVGAVNNLVAAHEVQLVNYLSATHIDNGLLINFGAPKLEIKRKFRQYKK